MAFINTRLSECVAYGFTGGPEYNTDITPMVNGHEKRDGKWMMPRHRYSAQYNGLRPAARTQILAAFHAARGRLHAFRFRDWNDYQAAAEPLVVVGGKTYLGKRYLLGAQPTDRSIHAPVTAVLSGAGSVNMLTGEVTGAAPGDTWTGEFDVWVRFDSDYNAFTIGNWQSHSADIELVEVRR